MISAAQKLSTFLKKKVNYSTWREDFLAQIRARHCLLCAGTHYNQHGLCSPCLSDLPWLTHACGRCGVQLPTSTDRGTCATCMQKLPHFDRCEGLFHYDFPIREMIRSLKFQGKAYYALPFGELLAERLQAGQHDCMPDFLMPTPLHPKRLRQRGFNQALELARIISRKSGTPLDGRSLVKTKWTPAQSELSARERARNLRQSFEVRRDLEGKHVALIDDIVTTGHTVNEISRVLKGAGALRVDVYCIARTPPPKS